jgi:hypothetical protein
MNNTDTKQTHIPDPNIILPASQKTQSRDSQGVSKKVRPEKSEPVLMRSFSRDVDAVQMRSENAKQAAQLKKEVGREKSHKKEGIKKADQKVEIPQKGAQQKSPLSSGSKSPNTAPSKTVDFTRMGEVPKPPTKQEQKAPEQVETVESKNVEKRSIPPAPKPPYAQKSTASSQDKKVVDTPSQKQEVKQDEISKDKPKVEASHHNKQVFKKDRAESDDQKKVTQDTDLTKKKDSSKTEEIFPKPPVVMNLPKKVEPESIKKDTSSNDVKSSAGEIKQAKPDALESALFGSVPTKQVTAHDAQDKKEEKDTKSTHAQPSPKKEEQTSTKVETKPTIQKTEEKPQSAKEPMSKPKEVKEVHEVEAKKSVEEQKAPEKMVAHNMFEKGVPGAEKTKDTPPTTPKAPAVQNAVPVNKKPVANVIQPKRDMLADKPHTPPTHIDLKKVEPPKVPKRPLIHVSFDELKQYKKDVARIGREIELMEAQLKSVIARKERLAKEKADFEDQSKDVVVRLEKVLKEEEGFEMRIHDLEKQELSVDDPKKRRELEEKRWQQEDGRAEIAQKKWDIQELHERLDRAIDEKDVELERAEESHHELVTRIETLTKERTEKKSKMRLGDVEQKKHEIEDIQVALLDEKGRLDKRFRFCEEEEKSILQKRRDLEKREQSAVSTAQKRELEQERRALERAQRDIEQKRWDAELAREKVLEKIAASNAHYATVSKIETELQQKIATEQQAV